MNRLKLFAAVAALASLPGVVMAQSYGATDPAFADTTDPNSAPFVRGYRAQSWQTHPGYGTYAYSPRGYDSYAYPQRGRGYDAYASGRVMRFNDSQSGGTGSPVAAGSLRGSTDRSSPNSPLASGPDGAGERHDHF